MKRFLLALVLLSSSLAHADLTNLSSWMSDGSGNPLSSTTSGSKQPLDIGITVSGAIVDPRTRSWTTSSGTDSMACTQSTAASLSSAWPVKVTDGTNIQPTGDVAARKIFVQPTDGTNSATFKAASTAPAATDTAQVVSLSPNGNQSTAANQTNGSQKTQIVDPSGNVINSLSDGDGNHVQMVAQSATNFVFSSNNSTTSQLSAGATFSGTIDSIINQQDFSLLLTSDQDGVLTINNCIDASCTFIAQSLTYYIQGGVNFSRSGVANGNYFYLTFKNTGSSTTTTLNINTYYGTISPSTSLNNMPVAVNEASLQAAGSITTTCSTPTTACPAGSFVAINSQGFSSGQVQLTGTYTGASMNIDGSADGKNWVPLLTGSGSTGAYTTNAITSNGKYRILRLGALQQFRVRASALTSGTVNVWMTAGLSGDIHEVFQLTPANLQASIYGSDQSTILGDGLGNIRAAPADGWKQTYWASVSAFTAATLATDIYCLQGSATKTVRVLLIEVSGTSTAGGGATSTVNLIRRSAANTGGTSNSITVGKEDTNNASTTASAFYYTTNPTSLGTAVATMRTARFAFQSIGTPNGLLQWVFGNNPGQALVLRGTSDYVCVNLNATTLTGNVISIDAEYSEE